MKQASYVAEVHSRLQYQKALERIVEQSSQGSRFVGDVLAVSDECEDEYMSGPAKPGQSLQTLSLCRPIKQVQNRVSRIIRKVISM